jgi:YfiH family protein
MSLAPHGEPPTYFTFPSLEALGLPHLTTTRLFPGVTSPSEPTAPFGAEAAAALRSAGLDPTRIAYARQVHGVAVARVSATGGFSGAVDILLTTEPGVPLAIFTADCLAVTVYDPEARALAVAHVGWRGTARGAAQSAINALRDLGSRPSHMVATISPSIGPCCYEVDVPVFEAFTSAYPELGRAWFIPGKPGHWMLDLWRATEDLLVEAGIPRDRIENARCCTACHRDLLYSYRKGHRGRLVTVAALP